MNLRQKLPFVFKGWGYFTLQEVSPQIRGFLDNTAEHYITPLSGTYENPIGGGIIAILQTRHPSPPSHVDHDWSLRNTADR